MKLRTVLRWFFTIVLIMLALYVVAKLYLNIKDLHNDSADMITTVEIIDDINK